ncbi:hypothetical protein PG993_006509 [Apiospora rasikravindrae]|uniref:Uncharacterized protein n=1 Tax=Apiospora rasikravindrae TaxID=990691 RepID=A0ABR1T5X1_9PEZI
MEDMEMASTPDEQLKLVHHLSDMDQSAPRNYVRRMYIFDFPDRTKRAQATAALRQGLKTAFTAYPHLTGRVGPDEDIPLELTRVTLRYGDTDATRAITDGNFQASYRKKATENYTYGELCQMNMPVSHWKTEDFGITPVSWKNEECVPAMTLKATFLGSGGLVLCFAFHHSLVDGRSISMFIETFAKGIRDPNAIEDTKEYVQPQDLAQSCEFDIGAMENKWDKNLFPEMNFDKNKPVYPYPHSGRCRLIKFPAKVIAELKDATVDVVSALMWVSLLRARHTRFNSKDHMQTSVFTTTVDLRRRDSDGLVPPDYFGNMSMDLAVTTRTIRQILHPGTTIWPEEGPPLLPPARTQTIAVCAYRIRQELLGIEPDKIEDRLAILTTLAQPQEAAVARRRAVQSHKYGVKVGSLVDSGADVDFGIPGTPREDGNGGRPRFIRKPWMADNGMVNIMPRRGGSRGDDDWVVLVCADSPVLEQLCLAGELGRWASGFVDDQDPSLWWERRFGARRLPLDEEGDDDEDGDVTME